MDSSNQGGLIINVSYADSALPIADADVKIDGKMNYKTGTDGKTEVIYLKVGTHSAKVRAENFYDVSIDVIPISVGRTTIQRINLFPVPIE